MPNAPKACQAALATRLNDPIVVGEVTVPQELEPGAMLVKTEVASICASDIDVWQGHAGKGMQDECPFIPGHEMVGVIVDSNGVSTDAVGQPLREGNRIVWLRQAAANAIGAPSRGSSRFVRIGGPCSLRHAGFLISSGDFESLSCGNGASGLGFEMSAAICALAVALALTLSATGTIKNYA